jgi:hypothetical protein
MALTAMWTHGTAVVAETPANLAKNDRLGFGADMRLRPDRECWCHVPMPTPVVLGDRRPKLLRVIILFRTDPGAFLLDVHLFDASTRTVQLHPNVTGSHLTQDQSNTFQLNPSREFSFALGVSCRFFVGIAHPTPQTVFVSAVGADWNV